MKPIQMLTSILAFSLGLAVAACGDDGGGDSGDSAGSGGDGYCEIGTPDCSCSAQFPCRDAGYSCIDDTCVECPKGTDGCDCDDTGACGDGLVCTPADPDCTLNCGPGTCEAS